MKAEKEKERDIEEKEDCEYIGKDSLRDRQTVRERDKDTNRETERENDTEKKHSQREKLNLPN